jgi:hypothetical protein
LTLGEGSEKPKIHALVIPKDLKSPIQIPIFNHSYEPLTFPLLYPTGNPGYIFKTKTEKNGEEGKAETFREYLKNKLLFVKQNNWSIFDRLLCEWILDSWSRYEDVLIHYYKTETFQKRIVSRLEYEEAIENGENMKKIGTILPPSFTNGPNMRERRL